MSRHHLLLHLGVSVPGLFTGVLVWIVTGEWMCLPLVPLLFNLWALTRGHIPVMIAYYSLKPFSHFSKGDGFAHERMVIALDSSRTLKKTSGIPAERILLLLPHCLQFHDCPHRITFDPANCRRCGKCPVGDLVNLAERTGVSIAIATGGTLARRHLRDKKPLAVVAVACPRDLGQGMIDAWPVPVYGIENSRPCGDCYDTRVDVKKVEKAIEALTS